MMTGVRPMMTGVLTVPLTACTPVRGLLLVVTAAVTVRMRWEGPWLHRPVQHSEWFFPRVERW